MAILTPEKRNVWNFVIQAIVAVLTALSGVFAGCSLAA